MTENEITKLVDQLQHRFEAHVEKEEISPGRYRLSVVSPQFTGLAPLHRQDRVWEAIDAALDRHMTLDISIVLAFSPEEVEVAPNV